MCELSVYTIKGKAREKVMDGVVSLVVHNEKVLLEGIFGDSLEVEGKLAEVNIIAQTADIIVA
ncbi:MAG: CooT family nickel-binding protein [Methanothrix sp.]|nr:CooT family nickel-binding protein [Methanothrix sp.]